MMQRLKVWDEVKKKFVPRENTIRVVIAVSGTTIVYGYTTEESKCVRIDFYHPDLGAFSSQAVFDNFKNDVVYSNQSGCYKYAKFVSERELIFCKLMGQGIFPYNFQRRYEAVESFNIFKDKQEILSNEKNSFAKELKYTFGLEFETSQGLIPESECFQNGLIPLRDGSISGLEYSTVVLEGNDGLNLLKQQLESLKNYTNFNFNCSLHIHFGNFPLTPTAIFNVYKVCKYLEREISRYVPKYTFNTEMYKSSQKSYCKKLGQYGDFDEMYYALVGRRFFGSFEQAHPNDVERKAKWNITTRYYWVNFINALCYQVNKTIEFRFLRPTFSYEKIVLWIFILNGILRYCDSQKPVSCLPLHEILGSVYPEPVFNYIKTGLYKLEVLTKNQLNNGDNIGADIYSEQKLFKW